jgi:hypothetical protein
MEIDRQLIDRLLSAVERLEADMATVKDLLRETIGDPPFGYDLLKLLTSFEVAEPAGLEYPGRIDAYAAAGIDPRGAGGLFRRQNTPGYLRWAGDPGGPAVLTAEGRNELGRLRGQRLSGR